MDAVTIVVSWKCGVCTSKMCCQCVARDKYCMPRASEGTEPKLGSLRVIEDNAPNKQDCVKRSMQRYATPFIRYGFLSAKDLAHAGNSEWKLSTANSTQPRDVCLSRVKSLGK